MSRPNTSVIWNYFDKVDILDKKAKCRICCEIYSYKGSTGNLKAHLKKKHLYAYTNVTMAQRDTRADQQQQRQQPLQLISSVQIVDECAGTSSATGHSQQAPRQQTMEKYSTAKKISNETKKKIDRDLLDLFIDSYQPFTLVEEKSFKKFARWIPGYQLPSRKTISTVMLPLYNQTKAEMKMVLGSECNYSVCITTDLWTSRANQGYIAVTGHYMTDDFVLKSILLDCCNFKDAHTSDNIQEKLNDIVAEWNLTNKINFAVSDNAANVQKAIQNIGWKQFGCYGHTLNLIVQDALAVTSISSILEKVKKIVRHFKTSSTALEKILKAQQDDNADCIPKRLKQEVPTRWNSTYHMVQRFVALEQYIRSTIAVLQKELPIITNDDWCVLSKLSNILQPFDQATETISGDKYMTGSLVIVLTRCLITACDKLIAEPLQDVSQDVVFRLRSGFISRFGLVERSRTFSLCTFLDPRYKLSVFSDQNEAENTRTYVQEMLVAMIAQDTTLEEQSVDSCSSDTRTDGFRAILQQIVGPKQHTVGTPLSKAIKEIDTYINDEVLPVFQGDKWNCPLEWWRGHKFAYPYLAKLIKKYGNIVASSVPCERIFSKTGLLINDRRTRLTSEKVRQLTFLNVNLDPKRFE